MAWDPSSSPWDWETDGVIVPNHGTGMDPRKLPIAGLACEAELSEIKHDGFLSQSNGSLCSSELRQCAPILESVQDSIAKDADLLTNRVVTPAMANIDGCLVINDVEIHRNISPMVQGRMPIVTTCLGSGAFIGARDYGNGSLESVVQRRFDHKQGSSERKNIHVMGVFENGRSSDKKSKMGIHCVRFSAAKESASLDYNGQDHLGTLKHHSNKSAGSICNGGKATVIDEQLSSTASGSAGSGDSLTGLQLGKRTYPLDVAAPAATKSTVKVNSVAKRSRGAAAAVQVPRCQVEGCKLDLSTAKDYHRRHKVCEPHSKAGKVVVASLEQRFCQQCSRFHVLSEFDETKRSCRRRLAGHNKRRRKPQPDPLELQARLQSSLEDWPFLYQSRFSRSPFWQGVEESHSSTLWPRKLIHYQNHPTFDNLYQMSETDMFTKGLSSSLTHDKFPLLLLQSPKALMATSSCNPRAEDYFPELVGSRTLGNGLSLSSSTGGAGVFMGLETTPVTEVTRVRVSDSGRALSLLSLHPQCSQAPDMVTLDLSGLATTNINHSHHMQEACVCSQQFLLQGQHAQQCQGFSTNLSISSNMHCPDSADVCNEEVRVMSSDKDLFECSILNNLHRRCGYEESDQIVALNMQWQSHDTTGQVKQTQDLMQLVVPNAHSQSSSTMFNVESKGLGESQFSAETSFLNF
ncbi:hypothetical protein L7F22_015270 [Adiantum nelumboides]|nr:hypothetical protein [Adiantum nelumboides]